MIGSLVPWQLKDGLRRVLNRQPRKQLILTAQSWSRADESHSILSFAGVLNREHLHGGAVKLLALKRAFEANDTSFNILYMVSSSLPPFAEDVVLRCQDLGIPLVWNQNGVAYPAWAGRESERWNRPMRRLYRSASHVIFQSEFCRKSATRFLGPAESESCNLLNPVDLERFTPRSEALPATPLRLLAMGTQNTRRRVLATLEALAFLRKGGIESTLSIHGRLIWPHAQTEVADWIDSMGLSQCVTVGGPFKNTDAPAIYRNHHLLIHAKTMDPCPTVVAEALASGLPVVATDSGGLREMVGTECGALIPCEENYRVLQEPAGNDLALAVMRILPELERHSLAARKHAEATFDETEWCRAHHAIFESLRQHG